MFSTLFGTATKTKRRSSPRPFLPRLEVLEGRNLPSTFTVVNLADSGAGSLRAAVLSAEANSGPDLINFAPAVMGTITLTSELSITQDLTIDGPRAENITISGGGQTRVFSVSGATTHVAIDDLTIADGRVQDDTLFGAGLLNSSANVSLARVVFTNNQAVGSTQSVGGGAIANLFGGSLTIRNATFRGNTVVPGIEQGGEGGAILNDAGSSAVIEDSSFIGNQATGGLSTGGAIGLYGGSRMTVSHCIFDNNLAQSGPGILAAGGAIDTNGFGSTLIVTGCSFTGNRAIGGNAGGPFGFSEAVGGAISLGFESVATVSHSTFQGNRARGGDDSFFGVAFGGAILNGSATLTVRSSIFIDNEARGGTSGNGAPGISADPGWDGIGGAIAATVGFPNNPTTDVADSLFVGNRAIGGDGGPGGSGGNGGRGGPGRGGAIANLFGTLTLTHSVLAGNEALGGAGGAAGSGAGTLGGDGGVGRGGGLSNERGGMATVSQVLIMGNEATGGRGVQGGNGGDAQGGGVFTGRTFFTVATLTLADSTVWNNQAIGGDGAFGGNGLGGGIFNGNTLPGFAPPILTVINSLVTFNQATGGKGSAGGGDGQGIGGGIYNVGTFFLDALSVVRFNHASTSDDDIFGSFVLI
jgi:hypothetical protein